MPKVVSLVETKRKASSGVTETLRNMAKAAKAEGFTGIAIAAVDKTGYTHTAFASGDNIAMLIGAVERTKYRLLMHQDGD